MKAMLVAACCAVVLLPGHAGAQGKAMQGAPASARAQTVEPAVGSANAGIFKDVRGGVFVLGSDGAMRPVRAGDAVSAIDRIETEAEAGAGVVLRDGTTLVLGPSSRLTLKEFHYDAATRDGSMLLSLLKGSMRMITGLIGKTNPEAVRIETQTITLGIRGTDFIVLAEAQP